MLRLDGADLLAAGAVREAVPFHLIEEHWSVRLELEKDEQQRSDDDDEKLHGDFHHRVEHQSKPPFANAGAAKVSLHLRLIRSEIGEREKKSAEEAGPKCVAFIGIN